jgi:hypothetical protein
MEIESALNSNYVKQFSVFLINRAGALLGVVKLLEDSQIHVLALSIHDSVDVTIVRLIVSDPDGVETLFMERGIPFGSCDLLVVELRNGPNDLSKCFRAFLEAETNIHFAYPIIVRPDSHALLALHLEDTDLGAVVMENQGFKTLKQKDLSR